MAEESLALKEKEVRNAVSGGDILGAMKIAVDISYDSEDEKLSKKAFDIAMSVFLGMKEADFERVAEGLSPEQRDVCMKYVYRGLEESVGCSVLLRFHAYLTKHAGLGSIVRAMTQ